MSRSLRRAAECAALGLGRPPLAALTHHGEADQAVAIDNEVGLAAEGNVELFGELHDAVATAAARP